MKIILFINKDFEANLAYNLLKQELLQHQVKIYYSDRVGSQGSKPDELQLIEYYEKEFFYYNIAAAISRHNVKTAFEFLNEDVTSFEVIKCPNVNSKEFIDEVIRFEPDLFLSIRFGKIFREEIIKIPKKGILNLHSAILPDYKGIMGTLHNLKDDKNEYGCTLHYISSPSIDTGEIIDIRKQVVEKERSLLWHIIKLYPVGCDLILDSLHKLRTVDKLTCISQRKEEGNYYSLPKSEDFQALASVGIEFFNMNDYLELIDEYISPELRSKLDITN